MQGTSGGLAIIKNSVAGFRMTALHCLPIINLKFIPLGMHALFTYFNF